MKLPRKLTFFCAATALASLGACQQGQTPAPGETGSAAASEAVGPNAKPGISASDGKLILPVISGRPAAVYFSVRNDGPRTVTLGGVDVTGAGKSEMHKTEGGTMSPVDSVQIGPGATIDFKPGSYHVMAFDLSDTLKAGDVTELTLTFSDGDKLSMPLRIETMGANMGDGPNGGMTGDVGGDMGSGMNHDMPGMTH